MGVLYEYLWAIILKWLWLVTGILFVLDKMLEWLWPSYRAWVSQTFSEGTRRRMYWRTLLFFVFLSAFLVWKDEHERMDRELARAEGSAGSKLQA